MRVNSATILFEEKESFRGVKVMALMLKVKVEANCISKPTTANDF